MTMEETLACFAEGVGQQVGALVKCLIQQEIQTHLQRIEQLQAIVNGGACTPTISSNTNGETPTA